MYAGREFRSELRPDRAGDGAGVFRRRRAAGDAPVVRQAVQRRCVVVLLRAGVYIFLRRTASFRACVTLRFIVLMIMIIMIIMILLLLFDYYYYF